MKIKLICIRSFQITSFFALSVFVSAGPVETNKIPNRLVDYDTFLANAGEVRKLRMERRVTEEKFMAMASEPGTIVYDARSDDKYSLLHIKGARH